MRAVLLLSGGLDSTTALAYYSKIGYKLTCLTFNYSQRNQYEISTATTIANSYQVVEHIVINIDSQLFNSISSLNSNLEVEKFDEYTPNKNFIPSTYLPSRNIIFLSFATGVAESRKIENIIFAANSDDSTDYPDCSLSFVRSFNKSINLGTHMGRSGNIKIHTPFIKNTKSEIIKIGLSLGVDYLNTQSCYNPDKIGNPCSKCDACLLREASFKSINLIDPKMHNLDY